jgi:hypothetical protein
MEDLHFVDLLNFAVFYSHHHLSNKKFSLSDIHYISCILSKVHFGKDPPSFEKCLEMCRDYRWMYFRATQDSPNSRPNIILSPIVVKEFDLEIAKIEIQRNRQTTFYPHCYIPIKIKKLYLSLSEERKDRKEQEDINNKTSFLVFWTETHIKCFHCESREKSKLKRCFGCKCVFYCSKKCQKQDWKFHKSECIQDLKKF